VPLENVKVVILLFRLVDLDSPVFWVDDVLPTTPKAYNRRYGIIQ